MSGIIHIVALLFSLLAAYAHGYQYDAWNRLVKVTENSTGAFVLHYTYDGLGRLVRRQGPYPGYPNEKRVEHYYYDGSRRIQEVMTDPVSNSEDEVESSDEPTYSYNIWTTREYVWSPHGPDVLLAQFEHITSAGDFAQPWFGVHDHSGDLVGVVDVDGTVREQRSYSPYGELLFVETFGKKTAGAASAGNPIVKPGHDGLFFDRFNASILAPPHAVGARGVYYNVNRSYSPHLGRFLQSDPNATGQMLVAARHATISGADALSLLSDGFNLYSPYGCSPVTATDPEGLFFNLIGITSAQGLRGEMQNNQVDMGMSVAMSVFTALSSGASTHAMMISALTSNGIAGDTLDGMLADFNRAVRDFNLDKGLVLKDQKHHVYAKFLGGDATGTVKDLSRAEHMHLHRMIDDALQANGLPRQRQLGSTANWKELLKDPAKMRAAERALMQSADKFDALYSKNIRAAIDGEILNRAGKISKGAARIAARALKAL